jgi:hypothetical protein
MSEGGGADALDASAEREAAIADAGIADGGSQCDAGLRCRCNNRVLFLGDDDATTNTKLAAAFDASGLVTTVVHSGVTSYNGTPAASSFGAVLVSPGTVYGRDMVQAGQQAIASANNAGTTGLVFTEWAAYNVSQGVYGSLAPLELLQRVGAPQPQPLVFQSTVGHPIWNGLPSQFTTDYAMSSCNCNVVGGGTPIASINIKNGIGVVVRELAARTVQLNHAGNYNKVAWTTDVNLVGLYVNAVKWAARCL